jgi:hypothetical protein
VVEYSLGGAVGVAVVILLSGVLLVTLTLLLRRRTHPRI